MKAILPQNKCINAFQWRKPILETDRWKALCIEVVASAIYRSIFATVELKKMVNDMPRLILIHEHIN